MKPDTKGITVTTRIRYVHEDRRKFLIVETYKEQGGLRDWNISKWYIISSVITWSVRILRCLNTDDHDRLRTKWAKKLFGWATFIHLPLPRHPPLQPHVALHIQGPTKTTVRLSSSFLNAKFHLTLPPVKFAWADKMTHCLMVKNGYSFLERQIDCHDKSCACIFSKNYYASQASQTLSTAKWCLQMFQSNVLASHCATKMLMVSKQRSFNLWVMKMSH